MIPSHSAYLAFFAASLVAMLTLLRHSDTTSSYVIALEVIAVGLIITMYETFKTLGRL